MNITQPSWPGWETTRLIGRGSFGAVYEIQREIRGRTEHAALKVISLPRDDNEIEALRADGYDDESITQYFADSLGKVEDEYAMMADLKGHSNIVYCDDILSVPHHDGFGWDIYIKMELLTPLKESLGDEISEAQVISLGSDICNALIHCEERNIVHRDIKPENIFISRSGSYKLGDFGIAKTLEGTVGGTKTGTYDYMAPEVNNSNSGQTLVDIYSLGIVMYWMLNNRTTPFLPQSGKKPTPSEKTRARERRFSGEKIPAPKNGSKELQRIVLKACAFAPKDRYQSAREMREDLQRLFSMNIAGNAAAENGNSGPEPIEDVTVGPVFHHNTILGVGAHGQIAKPVVDDDADVTVGPVFPPSKPSPVVSPASHTHNGGNSSVSGSAQKDQAKQSEKSKGPLLIAIAAGCFLLSVILLIFGRNKNAPVPPPTYPVQQEVISVAPKPTEKVKQEAVSVEPKPTEKVKEEAPPTDPPKAPSEEDVAKFGDVIAYPNNSSYLSSYETKYVKSTKGQSIYVYWQANGDSAYRRRFLLYEKDKVTVLARENGFSCVIFKTDKGKKEIGWVNSDLLVSEYTS